MLIAGISLLACKDDDEFIPNSGVDTRLEGKDAVKIYHVNPITGEPYTNDELSMLNYDPDVEEYYGEKQKVNLFVWTQQKPEKVEVFAEGTSEAVMVSSTFVREDRPEFSNYENGYGYSAKLKTNVTDLGILIDDALTLDFKVTYNDLGIDGFTMQSVRNTMFTINHYEYIDPNAEEDLSPYLKGYWRFDDPSNLGKATKGNDLILHGTESAVEGVTATDGATQVNTGSGYNVDHGLAAIGGSKLNVYTLIYDVNVPNIGSYVNLLQNNPVNSTDGTCYINPSGGFWNNGLPGSSGDLIKADTWHRVVLTLDAESGTSDNYNIYIDGELVYTSSIGADSYFAPETSNFFVFSDDNGEDGPIKCSELMLLNTALSEGQIGNMPAITAGPAIKDISQNLKGRWNFDDAANLSKAEIGNDLTLHGSNTSVEGVNGSDGATLVGVGSGYSIDHGLAAADGEKLNIYTLIYDVNTPAIGSYINLLQNNPNNDTDGTCYINPSGGFWNNGLPGSDSGLVTADTWHRIVITLDTTLDEADYNIYIDGTLVYSADLGADSYFAPELSNFFVFSDDNGEDGAIKCSDLLLFDAAMTAEQVAVLPVVTIPVVPFN